MRFAELRDILLGGALGAAAIWFAYQGYLSGEMRIKGMVVTRATDPALFYTAFSLPVLAGLGLVGMALIILLRRLKDWLF